MSLQNEDNHGAVKVERAACPYKNMSHKFKFEKKREFKTQYAHIYFARLQKMKKSLQDSAKRKWGDVSIVPISGLKDLTDKCCIVGTLFKEMELKPSILKEISQQHHLVPLPPRKKYLHKTDSLVLEDEAQRINLTGDIPVDELLTGITIALLGKSDDSGKFHFEEYCFAGECPTIDVTMNNSMNDMSDDDDNDKYIAIVSGLNVGSAHCDQLSLQLFIDYITGTVDRAANRCSSVVRLIVAGNCITDNPVKSSTAVVDSKTKYQTKNYSAQSIEAVKELDTVLTQLASCLPVDVMPGSHDPTNHMLPQHPLHCCMFPQASRYSMLQCVTNPYQARVGGVLLLGTSGQNIDDAMRFSSYTDPMAVLEHTLSWKHLAPTTPDTLSCFPYTTDDPFILEDHPQIYFAANQASQQHKIIKDDDGRRTCLLTVPNFDQTHSCVLVNLKTLKCSEIQFRTSLVSSSPSVPHPMDTGDTPMAAQSEEDINYMELYQDDNDDDMD